MDDLELREALAVELMGWERDPYEEKWTRGKFIVYSEHLLPAYESDIAAAWLVVEKMLQLYPEWNGTPQPWRGLACRTDLLTRKGSEAATEICRAALAAIRSQQ